MKTTILRFNLLLLLILMAINASAQYMVTVEESSDPTLKIVMASNTEQSTLFYVTKTAQNDNSLYCCADINATAGYKKYKLKNIYNIPRYNEAEPSGHYFSKSGETLNYILEFERLPMNTPLNIKELSDEETQPWKVTGVTIDSLAHMDYIAPSDFINATPSKICGQYASKGTIYSYYINNGIVLTAHFSSGKNYGKYYTVFLDIINNSDHSIAFNPANVSAEGITIKKDIEKTFDLQTLTADEYDKKVRSRQAWSSFFNAFGQSMAANNAGVTTVNTSTTTNSYGSSETFGTYSGGSVSVGAAVGTGGAAVGVGASAYSGNSYSKTYTDNTTTTNSTTVINDGAIRYMAQQQAAQNIAAYDDALAANRASLWENYLKLNTIKTGERYGGFFNIKYKKADLLIIKIKIDGVDYYFRVRC